MDNKRSEIAASEFKEILYCLGCGECLLHCPAYAVYGNRFGSDHHLGGRGVLFSSLSEGITKDPKTELSSCLSCGHCRKEYPVRIDTTGLVTKLRHEYPTMIPEAHLENAYRFTESHLKWAFAAARLEILALLASALRVEIGITLVTFYPV
ncbi:MAG: 4Fe-4S dicluster domain-containing protein [Dehalococcoidia bacterium]|nr:4Fe-4S dicluster domain-containing protein [Dehalococcoidia bacterium]